MSHNRWDTDMVGVLAEEGFVKEQIGKEAVFVNSQNVIQFYVRLISQPPASFPDQELITCYGDALEEKWGFEDPIHQHPMIREQELRSFLKDSLIVFHVQTTGLPGRTQFYVGTHLRLIGKTDRFHPNQFFVPLPVFSQESHGITFEEFLNRLMNQKYLGHIEHISKEPNDTPPFILWKDPGEHFKVLGEFTFHHYAYGGFRYYGEDIRMMDMTTDWSHHSYLNELNLENIALVTKEVCQEISDALKEAPPIKQQKVNAIEELDQTQQQVAVTVPTETATIADKETNFLADFVQLTKDQGLLYDETDLYNFHTAMKSSNLVILAGMSGTGKSCLVQTYSRALGLEDHQLAFISVRPDWSDDTDLIGYTDMLHKVYRPGDSGLINVLRDAAKEENRDKLYLVCFDEMNLSRVEHYFSQFLSVLEKEHNRELRLYNDDLTQCLYNSTLYPPTIPIGDNVLFVGTVNLDESTYHFSDKVLDRANVIRLHVMPFHLLKELEQRKQTVHHANRTLPEISLSTYQSFQKEDHLNGLTERELEFLWTCHEAIQQVNNNIGIGPRIVRQIGRYLNNVPKHGPLNRQNALDLQVVQRIVTKIRGPEDLLCDLLGRYNRQTGKVSDSPLLNILGDFRDISFFTETRKALQHKTKELEINGYTV